MSLPPEGSPKWTFSGPSSTFTIVKQAVTVPDCDRYLPGNPLPGREAFLTGITVAARGEIYLTATGCRSVVKLDSAGRISTVLKAESPWSPTGVALKGDDLYVAEWTNAHSDQHDYRPRVRRLARDGKVTIVGIVPE